MGSSVLGVEVVRAGLPTGDYSLAGHEGQAAIECKSLDDLSGVCNLLDAQKVPAGI